MQTFLRDKPYGFVPLNSKSKRTARKDHSKLDEQLYSGKLFLEIETLTPIHINDGLIGIKDNEIYNKTMRRAGKVIIPGSSLKGVVRSIAEAISESCAVKLPAGKGIDTKKLLEALPKNNRDSCKDIENLCPICSVFGMAESKQSYRGKIQFGEFTLINVEKSLSFTEMPNLASPFSNYPNNKGKSGEYQGKYFGGNERLYYCDLCSDKSGCENCTKEKYFSLVNKRNNRTIKFRGRKFYYHNPKQEHRSITGSTLCEVINKDSVLEGYVIFENLTKEELGLLAHSLGLAENINLKIGYGKPAYFGSIKVKLKYTEDLLARYGKNSKINNELVIKLAKEYKINQSEEIKGNIASLEKILGPNIIGKPWPNNKVY